jgi:uncharacterized membrane protein
MEPLAVALVLLSACLHSIWNYFAKSSLDKFTFSWWMKICELLVYLPIGLPLFIGGAIPRMGWFIILTSGIIHFAYWWLLSASYTHGDLSVVYPIARSAPLFVMIIAVLFLDEPLSLTGIIGIIAVVLGVFILSIESFHVQHLLHSLSILRNKAFTYAFLTALSVTAYSLVDAHGAKHFHPILYVWMENAISTIPFSFLILWKKRQRVAREWQHNKWFIIIAGFLGPLSYAIIIFTMQTYQVSYIVSIRQMSVIFGVILGGTLLKEEHLKTRVLSSLLIFSGLFSISIS